MENTIITFTLNNMEVKAKIDEKTTLLEVIRNTFGLTGTKEGCGYGKCGTCVVIMDGKAVKSCIVKAGKADGTQITTIEGVADGFTLDPVQLAFIEGGAVQCGFCTPGLIMTVKALFEQNLHADDEEIKKALQGHLCRCTGYQTIFDSAKLAQKKLQQEKSE